MYALVPLSLLSALCTEGKNGSFNNQEYLFSVAFVFLSMHWNTTNFSEREDTYKRIESEVLNSKRLNI